MSLIIPLLFCVLYLAGVIIELSSIKNTFEWISVADKLPDAYADVIIWARGDWHKAVYDGEGGFMGEDGYFDTSDTKGWFIPTEVT